MQSGSRKSNNTKSVARLKDATKSTTATAKKTHGGESKVQKAKPNKGDKAPQYVPSNSSSATTTTPSSSPSNQQLRNNHHQQTSEASPQAAPDSSTSPTVVATTYSSTSNPPTTVYYHHQPSYTSTSFQPQQPTYYYHPTTASSNQPQFFLTTTPQMPYFHQNQNVNAWWMDYYSHYLSTLALMQNQHQQTIINSASSLPTESVVGDGQHEQQSVDDSETTLATTVSQVNTDHGDVDDGHDNNLAKQPKTLATTTKSQQQDLPCSSSLTNGVGNDDNSVSSSTLDSHLQHQSNGSPYQPLLVPVLLNSPSHHLADATTTTNYYHLQGYQPPQTDSNVASSSTYDNSEAAAFNGGHYWVNASPGSHNTFYLQQQLQQQEVYLAQLQQHSYSSPHAISTGQEERDIGCSQEAVGSNAASSCCGASSTTSDHTTPAAAYYNNQFQQWSSSPALWNWAYWSYYLSLLAAYRRPASACCWTGAGQIAAPVNLIEQSVASQGLAAAAAGDGTSRTGGPCLGINPVELDQSLLTNTRYFVIKSNCDFNILQSVRYGVWCSTSHGNRRLDYAYRWSMLGERRGDGGGVAADSTKPSKTCSSSSSTSSPSSMRNGHGDSDQHRPHQGHILLFFSIAASNQLFGVAQMTSHVDLNKTLRIWSQSRFKGCFHVKWLYIKAVPSSCLASIEAKHRRGPTAHLRDATEIEPPDLGADLVRFIHSYAVANTTIPTTAIVQDAAPSHPAATTAIPAHQQMEIQQQQQNDSSIHRHLRCACQI